MYSVFIVTKDGDHKEVASNMTRNKANEFAELFSSRTIVSLF